MGDPSAEASLRLGPLAVQPRIALTNVGMDSNVFNQATGSRRDFTGTFLPGADSWLHAGPALFSGRTSLEWLYFKETASQRSFAVSQEERVDVLLARVTPFAGGGYVSTYQRPNAEIDARVRRTTQSALLGTQVRLGARTDLVFEGRRELLGFADQQFEGVSLSKELNRRSSRASVALELALTPLTTFIVRTDLQRDRFTSSTERDTDSISVLPGFQLKPSALISGTAIVGYRHFRSVSRALPDFTGAVAQVDVQYHMRETTKIGLQVNRNVDYSYQPQEPYFVATGGQVSITQGLGGRWDGVARVGQQTLNYQRLRSASSGGASGRTDRQILYGSGIGYHLAAGTRIGFDVNYDRRLSPDSSRRYEGFRFGGSFTYGS